MDGDRNLLVGILALQNEFVSREQLIEALHRYAADRSAPLAELLEREGHLRAVDRALLEALVERRLTRHRGDVDASIAAATVDVKPTADDLLRAIHGLPACGADVPPASSTMPFDCESSEIDPTATFIGKPSDQTGRYTVLRPHAAGGLGEVFVARDNELRREVALKQMRERFASQRPQQARFLLEAEITGGLEHPGIVPVYSLGKDAAGRPFYAMRFIRGESLKDAIDRFHAAPGGPDFTSLEFRNLLRRFSDVCNAMAYAHSRGVLHRDLKPGNIMLGKFGETLIVDWGLAKAVGEPAVAAHRRGEDSQGPLLPEAGLESSIGGPDRTLPGSALGTPAYMSPEQAEGRIDELGPATDIYGLGATLYALLVGRPAFVGETAVDILVDVQQGRFERPRLLQSAVPAPLEAVCLKAMSLLPSARYAAAADLTAEVERYLADEPVLAYAEPTLTRCRRSIRKHPVAAAGVAATTLVGLASLAIGFRAVDKVNRDLVQANERLGNKNVELDAALKLANEERRKAEANEAKAETEFRRAKRAIDEYFSDVSQSRELRQKFPGMQEFRHKLLERARGYYESFLKERGDDPKLQADAARAFFNSARVAADLGKPSEALAGYRAAIAIRERLAREAEVASPRTDSKTARELAADLAKAHNNVGILLFASGDLAGALASYGRAADILAKLSSQAPSEIAFAADLAKTHNNLALLHADSSRPKEARTSHLAALAIRRKLVAENPNVDEYAVDLARSLHNLGALERSSLNDAAAALAHFREAKSILERLTRQHPETAAYAADLANAENSIGVVLAATEQFDRALDAHRSALAVRAKLAKENPSVADLAADLAASHNNVAILLNRLGKTEEALASHRAAIVIQSEIVNANPKSIRYAMELAASHANLAALQVAAKNNAAAATSYRAALAILAALVKANPDRASLAADLAGCHTDLGELSTELDKPADALTHYRAALVLHADMAKRWPKKSEHQSAQANLHNKIGIVLRGMDKPKEAVDQYRAALAILESLAKEHATDVQYAVDLGGTCCNLGRIIRDHESPQVSLAYFDRAVATLTNLATKDSMARKYLVHSRVNRGTALVKLGRFDEAIAEFDKALAIDDGSNAAEIKTERAAAVAAKRGNR